MNAERELRSKRKQVADNNIKSKNNKARSAASSTPPAASTTNKKEKTVAQRSSITATARLSTSNRATTVPGTPKESLNNRITLLESRLSVIEASFERLTAENSELKETVERLNSELAQVKLRNVQSRPLAESSSEQQEINSNIVIRGVDVSVNSTASELTTIYEGIRNHLEISGVTEFDPTSISLLPSNTSKPNSSLRPIRVTLSSVAAKVKFLQVRHIKKDIVQSDIGIANNSKRPILITEQLTRTNQELLFQARSLREGGNYKFVWSKNGEVFARYRPNTKVLKIIDTSHVNFLRAELNLEPLSNNGRLLTSTAHHSSTNTETV